MVLPEQVLFVISSSDDALGSSSLQSSVCHSFVDSNWSSDKLFDSVVLSTMVSVPCDSSGFISTSSLLSGSIFGCIRLLASRSLSFRL